MFSSLFLIHLYFACFFFSTCNTAVWECTSNPCGKTAVYPGRVVVESFIWYRASNKNQCTLRYECEYIVNSTVDHSPPPPLLHTHHLSVCIWMHSVGKTCTHNSVVYLKEESRRDDCNTWWGFFSYSSPPLSTCCTGCNPFWITSLCYMVRGMIELS